MNNTINAESEKRIEELFSEFQSSDGAKRQQARRQLVSMGNATIPFLTQHLDEKNDRVRWELAKTLEELKDPAAAMAMVELLKDDTPEIRWLAGEGLINLKGEAVIPLLRGMKTNFNSTFFREGAHHVLRELAREGVLNTKTLRVIDALDGPAPAASTAIAAAEALRSFGND